MWKPVNQYSLSWRQKRNSEIIWLRLPDRRDANIKPDSVQKLAALGDMLPNQKSVYYHTGTGDLSTEWAPSGEEEM